MKLTLKVLTVLLVVSTVFTPISAQEPNIVEITKHSILQSNNVSVEEKNIIPLWDINGNQSYTLITFTEGGYAIVTDAGVLSEFDLNPSFIPYTEFMKEEHLIYGGPNNYIRETAGHYYDTITGQEITFAPTNENREANNEILSQEYNPRMRAATNYTNKIASSRMSRYQSWINKNNTCGSYSSGIMLAYYQDYLNISIPSYIRNKNGGEEQLIVNIARFVESFYGTIPADVGGGLQEFMNQAGISGSVGFTSFGTWEKVVSGVNSARPLAVGMTSIAGSSYGNHWVTVYDYRKDASGNGYYRCVDNWGSYTAEVNTSWTIGAVWLTN